jgi:class I fructose-bisphosphate aldolase
MSSAGKTIRLNRFFARRKRAGVIVPIDHALTMGPIAGLENTDAIASWIQSAGITGIIAHKGMVERLGRRNLLSGLGVMVHLNGMSQSAPDPNQKEMLTEIDSALRLGADAVSLQVNFDGQNDAHNLRLLGGIVDEAAKLNVPVLAMVYDVAPGVAPEKRLDRIRHLARISIELGVDAMKLRAPDSARQVRSILEHASADAAIFFAGGEACSDESLLSLLSEALKWGGAGLCAGRNVFQREARERQQLLDKVQSLIDPGLSGRAADNSSVIELSEFAEGWVQLARPG